MINMKNFRLYIYMIVIVFVTGFTACSENEWDNHVKGSDENLNADILSRIKSNPDLSIFARAIEKTGYDVLLSQTTNFTIFAPLNSAWAGIDTTDTNALRKIIAYQVAYGKSISSDPIIYNALQMVNTKYMRYDSSKNTFEGAKIISADNIAGNGVFHIVDKTFNLKSNVLEYILANYKNLNQVKYIESLNTKVMDKDKSIQIGVNSLGQLVYDTVWVDVNTFLQQYPINSEDSLITYVVLEDDGFDALKNKYMPYLKQQVDSLTEPLAKLNVCQDFVISLNGIVDITASDTVINMNGMKVPINPSDIKSTYEASNGRVYVVSKSNVLLREKIRPIKIEGENYSSSSSKSNLYTRFRRWASGEKDLMLNCRFVQTDTMRVIGSQGQDSTYLQSKTFYWDNEGALANVTNFHVKYETRVNSVDYEIHYVAYDDIASHSSDPNHIFRFEQKLFISMPGKPDLAYNASNGVINNYLGDKVCFVSQDTAGIHKQRKMKKWDLLNNTTQYLSKPISAANADVMTVAQSGKLTMWLCNTARTNAVSAQGMLFLDYILLVPKLPAE